ncbi:muconolactone Delta-isomerase family protein [Acinetobacter pittii]|nr:muconolactone Delta-isomerase family protein [Acinetobacter pittii]
MLFYVRKDVILPSHLTEQEIEDIKARERAYSQEIQRQGK